ncbi:MAG: metallophosphatase family protein [Lactobacillus sp.]|uniref:metallophosphoesterase family protein n=1 Tax=Limosilactobacillus coleohominis TaxID=181675 RepID=UPI002A920C62|nr:metallophosphoesterase family protein [Limosilactobacillus coleohominis]MCI5812831.1 metallophosphatase family protein [Lactobacillus sp.]MDY5629039.1 metallophosphoesterase family protein [Limosilactobacillus coleohominis]
MTKRIAIFSDVHGNVHAFQAMYQDAIQQGIDESWFVGDLLMPGPGISSIWQIFKKLQPTVIVRGNWDDLTVRGARGQMDLDRPSHVYFARLAQYIGERVDPAVIDEIASWPLHQAKKVGALTFGISHNLPDLDMGQALFPTNDSSNFDQLFADDKIDVAIYAHVHHELLRYASDERKVLNPGSVGEPFNGWDRLQKDTRAYYLIMDVDDLGIAGLNFRHVAYDREAEGRLADESGVPYLYLYHRTLESGRVDTHNQPLVDEQNQKFGYAEEYRQYARKLNNKK